MRGYSGSGLVWVPQYNLRAGGAGGVRGPRRVSAGYKRQQSSGPRAAGEGGRPHSGSRGWRRARRADGASLRRMSRRARQRWDGPVAGRPMERQSHARELQGCDRTSVFDGVPARAGIVFLARARVGDSPGVRGCRGCRGTGRVRRGRGCRPALARSRGLSRHVSRSGPFRSLSAGDLVRTISRAARSHTTGHSRNAARQRFLTLSAGSLLSARRRRRPALAPLLREACDELEELWRVQHGLETLRRLASFYQVYRALPSAPGVARAARTAARHPCC